MLRQSTYAYVDRVVESYQRCIKVVVIACLFVQHSKFHNKRLYYHYSYALAFPFSLNSIYSFKSSGLVLALTCSNANRKCF